MKTNPLQMAYGYAVIMCIKIGHLSTNIISEHTAFS